MTFVIDPEVKKQLSEEAIEDITKAVEIYLTVRALEAKTKAKAAQLVEEADDLLFPHLATTDIEQIKLPGAGRIDFDDDPISKGFDKEVLQTTLLESGVTAKVIAKAMKAAKTEKPAKVDYVIKFTKESKKKGKK